MGQYLSTHIGPVLMAKYRESDELVPYRGCANSECSRFRKPVDGGSFCSQCGQIIVQMTDPSRTQKVVHPTQKERWDALDQTGGSDDLLHMNGHATIPKGYHVFLPNLGGGPRKYSPELAEHFTLDIDDVDIDADKLWFVEKFAKEIEAMSGVYEQVEVRWVIMNYTS